MTEESSQLKSAQEKIIELMEKSHAMELKVKDQEMDALKVKHAADTEKMQKQLAESMSELAENAFKIADLEAQCTKQKTYIEELEASLSKMKASGPAS